jgi:hypothetical protein
VETVGAYPRARPFRSSAAVARRDITPPDGIAIRNWGASPWSTSRGTHRPLTATALALGDDDPLVVIALDLGWWRTHEDEWRVRGPLLEALDLPEERLLLALSHTHAGPSLHTGDDGREGWELVGPYLAHVAAEATAAAAEALERRAPCELALGAGWSALATDRDLDAAGEILCGFNPNGSPDGTLVIARVTNNIGVTLATVLNYACHPTTLAWDNRSISPDWVGAARELVERATGAPCLYLQGASGELAPLEQYTGDLGVAERNGRQLGYATLAALEELPRPGHRFEYVGRVESGTAAAVWTQRPLDGSRATAARRTTVTLPLRPHADVDELRRLWGDDVGDAQLRERLWRLQLVQRAVGSGPDVEVPYWVWRLGDALVVAQPCEAYSMLQLELRRRLDPHPVLVVCVANGCTLGYLVPADLYDERYQAWQSPFAPGALERLVDAIEATARELLAESETQVL